MALVKKKKKKALKARTWYPQPFCQQQQQQRQRQQQQQKQQRNSRIEANCYYAPDATSTICNSDSGSDHDNSNVNYIFQQLAILMKGRH